MKTPFAMLDVGKLSLQPPVTSFPELYYPLWWYSAGSVSVSISAGVGYALLTKGGTGTASAINTTPPVSANAITINASTDANMQYALEIALSSLATSGLVAYAQLWDVTAKSAVNGSQVSLTFTSLTVVRSGKFTLIPGHTYAVSVWSSNGSYSITATDASLISFPSDGSVSPSLSNISLAGRGSGLKEAYYPLWIWSNSEVSAATAGNNYLQKGSGSVSTNTLTSSAKLHTLNPNWSASQKFAFEASIYTSQAGQTASAYLFDVTANQWVGNVSTTSTAPTLVRSSSFAIPAGHVLAVCIGTSSTSAYTYITKAHLVALNS